MTAPHDSLKVRAITEATGAAMLVGHTLATKDMSDPVNQERVLGYGLSAATVVGMGAIKGAGGKIFTNTQSGFNSKIFTQKSLWTAPSGTKQTYKIYQRNDINWDMVRTSGPKAFVGKTNKKASLAGLSPQLSDGAMVKLHHVNQDARGPLVEVHGRLHDPSTQETFKPLHNQFSGKSNPDFPVDHKSGTWTSDRTAYWKWRASNGDK